MIERRSYAINVGRTLSPLLEWFWPMDRMARILGDFGKLLPVVGVLAFALALKAKNGLRLVVGKIRVVGRLLVGAGTMITNECPADTRIGCLHRNRLPSIAALLALGMLLHDPSFAIPTSDGFDYPIGTGTYYTEAYDGDAWYNAQDFGDYNGTYNKYHLGEDWNANTGGSTDCGQPVYAVSKGTIVFAGSGGTGWGNVIIVRHQLPDGTFRESLYGHVQSFVRTSGDVARREQIATIGDGGGAVVCHLHLEIRDTNCPSWGNAGPGYSVTARPAGWLDPSDFIDSHRSFGVVSGHASISNLTVPSSVILGQNFNITVTLKEVNGAAKTFDKVAIAILKSDGSLLFDFAIGGPFDNVTVPANGTWTQTATNYIYATNPPGTYKAEVRGNIAGSWFTFDTTGSGANTVSFAATAAPTIPTTPTNPSPGTIASPGPTQAGSTVGLSWGAVTGATSYSLGIKDIATGNLVVDTTTTGPSYSAALAAGKQYRWNVAACNAAGCSGYTTVLYFQTPSAAPTTPTGTSPGTTASPGPTQAGSTVGLSWGAVTGATSYSLGVTDMATGTLVVNTTTTSPSYSAALAAGKQYRWNVAACNTSGCSGYTTVLYFQTPSAVPTTPTGTSPGTTASPGPTQAGSTVGLSWGAVTGATSYSLGIKDIATGNLVVDTTTTGPSYSAALAAGKQYRWNVAACNAAGCSGYTTVLYFQTPTAVPAIPTGATPGTTASPGPTQAGSTVGLSWGAVTGATSYSLGIKDIATGNLVVDTTTTGPSYSAALAAGKQYRWNVAACNTAGCSGYTTVLYFQTPSPLPVCSPTATPTTITTGGSTTLAANCSNNPTSYTWTSSPSNSPKPSGSGGAVSPSVTTTYYVTATNAGGTSTQQSVTVQFGNGQPATVQGSGLWNTSVTFPVCSNTQTGTLNVTYSAGAYAATYNGNSSLNGNCAVGPAWSCSRSGYGSASDNLTPSEFKAALNALLLDCTGGTLESLTFNSANSVAGAGSYIGYPFTASLTRVVGSIQMPLTLAQGWNLLGNSLNQTLAVATLFGNADVVATVWKWDAANGRWLLYSPLMDSAALQTYATGHGYGVLSQIGPGEGYWVNAKLAAQLAAQTGSPFVLGGANLVAGWNLVATGDDVTPSAFNRSLSVTPPSPGTVPQNITSLWAWDNPANGWYFYAPSLEGQGGTALTDYINARGYLDFTQHNKKLGNGTGFWVRRP